MTTTSTTASFFDTMANINYGNVILAFACSLVVGLFIMFVYKKTYAGVMYSRSFGVSLVAMCLITNVAILAVTQNVVLSLGMVGALSIVRFRSAVKEPMEIAFLFWAISEGIVIGAGMIPIGLIGAVFVSVVLILFSLLSGKGDSSAYILVVQTTGDTASEKVMETLSRSVKKVSLKAKNVNANGAELTVELRLKGGESTFVDALSKQEGVTNVSLVSYNGDYMA